jgi:hypothetical protein
MRDFCAAEGITFLDLTAELRSRLGAGHKVYFPDDSHWNAGWPRNRRRRPRQAADRWALVTNPGATRAWSSGPRMGL